MGMRPCSLCAHRPITTISVAAPSLNGLVLYFDLDHFSVPLNTRKSWVNENYPHIVGKSRNFLQYHCQKRNNTGKTTTMDQIQLFEEAKEKLGARSWYHFAQLADMDETEVGFYRRGKRVPDVYACFKLAEILGKSQAEILAAIHATSEKNETKRLYFKRFFSTACLWIILVNLSASFMLSSESAHAHGTGEKVVQNHSVTCVLC